VKENNLKYFTQTFAIMVLSIIAFVLLKPFLPEKLFPVAKTTLKNIVVDSLMLEAIADEKLFSKIVPNDSILENSTNQTKINESKFTFEENDYVGYQHLISLFDKLNQLEKTGKGKIRIAFYGDSMNDGDMIVQDFRANFQNRFGGNGVGFVNITSESSASRSTIKQQYSKNWKSNSFVNTKNLTIPFGISGNIFYANDTISSNWISFEASKAKHLTELNDPTLFYGKSDNKNGQVLIIRDKDTIYKNLKPSKLVNELDLGDTSKKIKIEFKNARSIPLYGFDFTGKTGVYVDNFSNRGNSGLPITNLKSEILSSFNTDLNYDLIVLQYGTNVLGYGSKNFTWYQNRMKKVVEHLQNAMPNVAILVISIADKSSKYETQMKTDSAVLPLIKAQLNYAKESNASFVNLYQLMGGDGSMVKWVEEEPAKANKDYTHLNFRGSKLVSDLIYNKLMFGYEQYLKQNNKPKIVKSIKKDTLNAGSNKK